MRNVDDEDYDDREWDDESDDDRYEAIRGVLAAEYAELPTEDINRLLHRQFGEMSAEELEDFLEKSKKFGRFIGKTLKTALPGAIKGAIAGAPLGPAGIFSGAALGGASSALQGSGKGSGFKKILGTAANIGLNVAAQKFAGGAPGGTLGTIISGVSGALGGMQQPRPGASQPAGGSWSAALGNIVGGLAGPPPAQEPVAPQPQAPVEPELPIQEPGLFQNEPLASAGMLAPPSATAPQAAVNLLQTLMRPEVSQALMAMIMGPTGRQDIDVNGTPVPTAAFANLLGSLANRAAAEYYATVPFDGENVPRYLIDASGQYLADPSNPDDRASVLLRLLNQSDEPPAAPLRYSSPRYSPPRFRYAPPMFETVDYDALELAEMYFGRPN